MRFATSLRFLMTHEGVTVGTLKLMLAFGRLTNPHQRVLLSESTESCAGSVCTDKSDRREITAEVPGRRSRLIVNAGHSDLLTP